MKEEENIVLLLVCFLFMIKTSFDHSTLNLYPFYCLLMFVDWYLLLVLVVSEKVLVYLDRRHLHHRHHHQDFQLLNWQHSDHDETMCQKLDAVVEMEHILNSPYFHLFDHH